MAHARPNGYQPRMIELDLLCHMTLAFLDSLSRLIHSLKNLGSPFYITLEQYVCPKETFNKSIRSPVGELRLFLRLARLGWNCSKFADHGRPRTNTHKMGYSDWSLCIIAQTHQIRSVEPTPAGDFVVSLRHSEFGCLA